MNPLCHDCDEAPATKPWDCGIEHERVIGVRTVDLCDACWTKRDECRCDKCESAVPADELEVVQVAKATHSSPAEYEKRCTSCRPEQGRDESYERAAARAVSNDFQETGGKDWR